MAIRRGLVLGCGGTVGGAWTVGALAAVADELGWDPRTAEVIVGTSSGSSIAAMLGAGISSDELVAAQRGAGPAAARRYFMDPPAALPPVPWPVPTSVGLAAGSAARGDMLGTLSGLAPSGRGDTGFLHALADALCSEPGWVAHPATWIVAVDLGTGGRVAFGRPGHPQVPLGHALRASWAVPGWYAPVSAHGRRYADGGIVSPGSADLLAGLGLDEVVVIAPMASQGPLPARGLGGRLEGLVRRPLSRVLDAEIAILEAGGTRVLRRHPDPAALAAMGANFMDPAARERALDAALAQAAPAAGAAVA